MIREILAIKRKEVNKIMVPKNEVVVLPYNMTLKDVISMYRQSHYSRYPVYFKNMDQIVGVLYVKDIIHFWHEFQDNPIIEFVRLPHFVYEDRPALDVFLELQRLKLSLGVIIDEFGGVSGIVTVEDLIEEIVGDIEDEFDRAKKPLVEKITHDEYVLNTRMALDDFAEWFGITIDDNDVSTVGGLILKYADRIPRIGEEIKYKNFRFKILEGTRKKISKVKVKKM